LKERQDALAAFSAALDILDTVEREPDKWEEECLAMAIGALACGLYAVAIDEINSFSLTIRQRPPQAIARPGHTPPRFTAAKLRHGLDQVPSFSLKCRIAPRSPLSGPAQRGFDEGIAGTIQEQRRRERAC